MEHAAILTSVGRSPARATPAVRCGAVLERAAAELATLWSLYRDGFVRGMYSPGGLGSVLVLEADSVAQAIDRLHELPLLRDGIMALEVIELHPFTALQMLFATGSDGPGATTG